MTWEYTLIGLVVGFIIGALTIQFGNHNLRQQQTLQHKLAKSKSELDEYREELTSHVARSAELLNNMADDYSKLYQYMRTSSNSLLPDQRAQDKQCRYRLTEAEADNDQIPAEMQSRDYPEIGGGLRK